MSFGVPPKVILAEQLRQSTAVAPLAKLCAAPQCMQRTG
jgi:hypothetical protein